MHRRVWVCSNGHVDIDDASSPGCNFPKDMQILLLLCIDAYVNETTCHGELTDPFLQGQGRRSSKWRKSILYDFLDNALSGGIEYNFTQMIYDLREYDWPLHRCSQPFLSTPVPLFQGQGCRWVKGHQWVPYHADITRSLRRYNEMLSRYNEIQCRYNEILCRYNEIPMSL